MDKCTLTHKESAINSRETLVEKGVIAETYKNKVITSADKARVVIDGLNSFSKRNYGVDAPLFTLEKRADNEYYISGNKEAFDQIDSKRKELGIYDSKEKIASYNSRIQERSQDKQSAIEELTSSDSTKGINYQLESVSAPISSQQTLLIMKEAGKQMGIDFQDLAKYAKEIGLDINGVNGIADTTRGVVAIALGKENVALTEEVVHIATAIVEQTSPQLMTRMISEIGKYKIYDEVFKEYSGRQAYQLSDGKPNIRKIKKEAVDQLITRHIVDQTEGNKEQPTETEKSNRNLAQRLWDAILDFVKTLYNKSKVDIFAETAKDITSGNIKGTVSDIIDSGTYFNVADKEVKSPKEAVDTFYNKVADMDNRMILNPATATDKRHYLLDGTKRIALSVTEKIKSKNTNERTEFQKKQDDQMQNWGLQGHGFIENTILNDLIDKDGYRKANFTKTQITTELNPTIQKSVRSYLEDLISSYKEGTRFLVERKVVNEKEKGMLASTIDLIAIEPNDTTGIKADIYDWKFTNFDKSTNEDIPFFKQDEWKEQMKEYSKIVYNYGIKPNQLRRARMIPFIANYRNSIKGDNNSKLILSSLEVGKFDNVKETRTYLLPVPITTEDTGNKKINNLVVALKAQYDKLYKAKTAPEDKFKKSLRLQELSKAIRHLQVQLNFSPLTFVGANFLKDTAEKFKEFQNIDYTKLSKDEVNNKLASLIEIKNSAEKYVSLSDIFLSQFSKEGLSKEDQIVFDRLTKISNSTERMLDQILDIQRDFAVQIALKEGLTTEKTKLDVLAAEREVGRFVQTFQEGSKLAPRLIKLGSRLIGVSRNQTTINANSLIDKFGELLVPLQKEAEARNKSAFDMIGKVGDKNISLIRKISKKFYEDGENAKTAKNKKFFLDNMDVDAYMEEAKDIINKGIKDIDDTTFSQDDEQNEKRRDAQKARLKNSLDITNVGFNGYKNWQFNQLFIKHMLQDKHLSQEYVEMSKSKNALDMWNFFTALNNRGIDAGYLSNRGSSFFPLIEASMLQRLSNSKDVFTEAKDLFKDAYTVRASEGRDYSKLDPETNMLKKETPKPFTFTDRAISQLSTDLNKVGTLWIKALLDYEATKQIENTVLTLNAVEKTKGHVVVNQNGDIVFENGAPKVDERSNKNADIFEIIIDDAIYGLKENLSSLGNVSIKGFSEKISKNAESSENRQLSIKKGLQNSNKLIQAQAVGLKLLVAAPHYLSTHFQGFINSGQFYTFSDWERNHVKAIFKGGLSLPEKLLLDKLVPLTDNLASDKRKEIASKQGLYNYLASWSFNDIIMSTASFAVKKLQITNALAFNDNAMIRDGKIVNIRKYVSAEDRAVKYKMSQEERKALERTFEDRVKALKDKESLTKVVKIVDNSLEIPGVSDEEFAKYRAQVSNFSRKVGDLMSEDDKAGYRRDTLMRSFMMFRNWIPKGISTRASDIDKNLETDSWEYGRARAFFKTLFHVGLTGINKMIDVMTGTDAGLKIMDEILQEKKEAHFRKTGQELEITSEEFYDLMRSELANQAKELGVLVGLMGLIFAVGAAKPGSNDPDKNKYNFWAKLTNKLADRLEFYYNPLSFQSIAKGSFLPSLGVLVEGAKFFKALGTLTYAEAIGDQKLIDHTHPTKYFFDIIPVAGTMQKELVPYFFPDISKAEGVKTTTQTRSE